MKTFESWLMDEFHRTDGKAILDDNLPDAFDAWLENLDIEDWFELGDKYKEAK